jgi:hypothetical protein
VYMRRCAFCSGNILQTPLSVQWPVMRDAVHRMAMLHSLIVAIKSSWRNNPPAKSTPTCSLFLICFVHSHHESHALLSRRSFCTNGGQICTAHTRLLVHEKIKAPLLAKLKERCKALPFLDDPVAEVALGDRAWEPGAPQVLQPVICKSQLDKIESAVAAARSIQGVQVSVLVRARTHARTVARTHARTHEEHEVHEVH